MVKFLYTVTKFLVLYCATDRAWVVTDFFFASECERDCSGRTTLYGCGTPGYRPAEIMNNDRVRFSAKVDIWALGCVMYEFCT